MVATAQEYYDLLVQTSATGGFPAAHPKTGACQYLTTDGRRCAAGILYPPGVIPEELNSEPFNDLLGQMPELEKYLPADIVRSDVLEIQQIHDDISHHADRENPWDHNKFVTRLNGLYCFGNVMRQQPA
jgi:hypothetical protein